MGISTKFLERMSGHGASGAVEYEATVEEIKDNIKSILGEAVQKNGTFGDLEDRTNALQEAMSEFQPKEKEEAAPKKKRRSSDIVVDDDELQRVTEITTSLAEIGKNMSTMILSLDRL